MDNNQYLIVLHDGRTKAYSEDDFNTPNVQNFLKDNADKATAYRSSTYDPNDVTDADQYTITLPDGRMKQYSKADFETPNVQNFIKGNSVSVNTLRPYNSNTGTSDEQPTQRNNSEGLSNKALAVRQQYMDFLGSDDNKFLEDYNARHDKFYTPGQGGSMNAASVDTREGAYLASNKQKARQLQKQKDKLSEAYFTNPEFISIRENLAKKNESEAQRVKKLGDEYRKANNIIKTEADLYAPGTKFSLKGEDRTAREYDRAEKLYSDAATMYKAPSKYDDSIGLLNYAKGMGNQLTNVDFWSRGLTELNRNNDLRRIMEKMQELTAGDKDVTEYDIDKALEPSEKELLKAYYTYMTAQEARANDMSMGYSAGQSAVESLGFMAEFMMTGAIRSGVGKVLTTKGKSAFAKWLGREMQVSIMDGSEAGMKAMAARTANMSKAGQLLYKNVAKPVMEGVTHTLVQPGAYRTVSQNLLQVDNDKQLVSYGNAIMTGMLDGLIENWSESMGGAVEGVLNLPFKLADKAAGGIKIGNVQLHDLVRWVNDSSVGNLLREAGWNGFIGEIGEEYLGSAARLATGLMTGKEFNEQMWRGEDGSWSGPLELMASFGLMSGIGLVTNGATIAANRANYKQNVERMREVLGRYGVADEDMNKLFNTRFATMQDVADAFEPYYQRIVENPLRLRDIITAQEMLYAVGRQSFIDEVERQQKERQRSATMNQINTDIQGRQWWMDTTDQEGNKTRSVREITVDGRIGYVVGANNGKLNVAWQDGSVGFVDEADLADRVHNGTAVYSSAMNINDYLDIKAEQQRQEIEQARMTQETGDKLADLKARYGQGATLNLGTVESPNVVTVVMQQEDGVIVETAEGANALIPWADVANYAGTTLTSKSDAQIEREAGEAQLSQDEARKRIDDIAHDGKATVTRNGAPYSIMAAVGWETAQDGTNLLRCFAADEQGNSTEVMLTGDEIADIIARNEDVPAAVKVSPNEGKNEDSSTEEIKQNDSETPESEAESQETPVDFRGNPIKLKADGTVDQNAFWNADPEAWAKWKTEQLNDNGAYATDYIRKAIAKLQVEVSKKQNEIKDETDFDKLEVAESEIANLTKRIGMLEGIAQQYIQQQEQAAAEAAAAEAKRKAEEEEAKRKAAEDAKAAAEAEAARREEERRAAAGQGEVPDVTRDKASDARERGFRLVSGEKVERQGDIDAVKGNETEVKFGNNDDQKVKGQWAVVSASSLQPSHKRGQRNHSFFLTEAQPKERTDEASIVRAQQIAQNINPQEVVDGVTAYAGSPVTNSRGEVIQGNGRTDALQQMYEGYPDQAQKYRDYIASRAEEFGISADAIAGIADPVLVRMVDVNDEEAIRLGQMTAQDTESGGMQRIDAARTAKALGDKFGRFAGMLLATPDDVTESLSETVIRNAGAVIEYLSKLGIINPTQVQSTRDAKGNITPEAKQDLLDILKQDLFNGAHENLPTMFNSLPAAAQKAILSTLYRDMDSETASRIKPDIQEAVEIMYYAMQDADFAGAKKYEDAKRSMMAWSRQVTMDESSPEGSFVPFQRYSTFAIELATRFRSGTQKHLSALFNEFYNLVQGVGGDMFNPAEKVSKQEAVKRIFNSETNDTGREDGTAEAGNGETGSTGRPGGTGNPESEQAAGGGAEDSGEKTDSEYGSKNSIVTKDRYEELKKKLRGKLNNLNSGFDPETFAIGCEMAAYHMEAGARSFADFCKRMIADIGDAVRPYLKSFYNGARDLPGMEDLSKLMDSYESVSALDVNSISIYEEPEPEPTPTGTDGTDNTESTDSSETEEPSTKFKAGDKVVLDGKEMTVNSINKDGSYNLVYDPTGFLPVYSMGIDESKLSSPATQEQLDKIQEMWDGLTPEEQKTVTEELQNKGNDIEQTMLDKFSNELGIIDSYGPSLSDATGSMRDEYHDAESKIKAELKNLSDKEIEQLNGSKNYTLKQYANREKDSRNNAVTDEIQNEQEHGVNMESMKETPVYSAIGEVIKDKNTKTGEDIWVVKPSQRVDNDVFKSLRDAAKSNNGYWSTFKHGFLFKTEEDANNFNNSSIEGYEQTNEQRESSTAAIVSEAGSVAQEADAVAEDGTSTEEQLQHVVDKIDRQLESINDKLAVLGYYEADTNSQFNEQYGFMKSAEKKAVADMKRLAKSISIELGLNARTAKVNANVAPAGGDITMRIPLLEGKELYMLMGVNPSETSNGDNLKAVRIMWRIEVPSASGYMRYGSNNFEEVGVSYRTLVDNIKRSVKDYIPEQPNEITEAAKDISKKNKEKKKNDIPLSGDEILGDLFTSIQGEAAKAPAPVEDTPLAPTPDHHGYNVGDKVMYEYPGRKPQEVTITDFDEHDGRPILDTFGVSWMTEIGDWEYVKPIVNNNTESNEQLDERNTPDNGGLGTEERQEAERTVGTGMDRRDGSGTGSDESGSSRPSAKNKGNVSNPGPKKNTHNNHQQKGEVVVPKTTAARYKANVEAIRTMRHLVDSEQQATKEDMTILRQYTGWGGLGGYFKNTYTSEYRELKELLTPDEFENAVMSVNSAYFTPEYVVSTLWDVAKQLGFNGGNILEGSAGIGNILAVMPKSISETSDITAVEIDGITGNILKLLYPDADVQIKGFQDVAIESGSVDLAITNVPFVTGLRVFDTIDKDLSNKFSNIHDFCIAKNLRKLREGGLGIFISTRGTLDSSSSKKLRSWITGEGNCDVIGAYRLNNGTFDGTTVTSDIIVIRKRIAGQKSNQAIDISNVELVRTDEYSDEKNARYNYKTGEYEAQKIPVSMEYNGYFIEHPENMGGEMAFAFEKGDTFRPTSSGLYPAENIDQTKSLAKWVNGFNVEQQGKAGSRMTTKDFAEKLGIESVLGKEGQIMTNSKGDACVLRKGKLIPLEGKQTNVKGRTRKQVIDDYDGLKKALQDVLDTQMRTEDETEFNKSLKRLNDAYDNFVNRYGRLNNNISLSWLREDVDYASTSAIESYKEVEKNGKKEAVVSKTDVFKKRVLGIRTEPKPKNISDAVIVSLSRNGKVNVPYIAEVLDIDEEQAKKNILDSKMAYENPQTGELEPSYIYLSGNVREKLKYARTMNNDGKYDNNIEALKKVIPADIPSTLIDFSIGSDWMDHSLYSKFCLDKYDVETKFSCISGKWMTGTINDYEKKKEKNRMAGIHSDELNMDVAGSTLMLCAMNNTPYEFSVVQKFDGKTMTIKDQKATDAAAVRIQEIREEFKEWCRDLMFNDSELANSMAERYNDAFNNYAPVVIGQEFIPERFEGSVVTMGDKPFELRPHQKNAVIRSTIEPVILAHEVGTGKTFTLISAAMEMKRLGTANKPMIVVQNATVGQFVTSAKELYPNARILTVSEKDRTKEGRMQFYAKIKYNDWDLIIVPQSVFEMIPDSPERRLDFINEKIEEKMDSLVAARKERVDGRQQAQLDKELKKLEEERIAIIESIKNDKKGQVAIAAAGVKAMRQIDRRQDEVDDFDKMGIDALLVDEAHSYKRLGFETSIKRGVKGVDKANSKRSAGVMMKLRSIFDRCGWRNVVFATGTPISNTAAEIWTFMKYLMKPEVMKAYHIYNFDDFVRNFGNISQNFEHTTSGKVKDVTRFAAYNNVPELVRIWSSVSDTVRSIDADSGDGSKLRDKIPELEGGKAVDKFLDQTPSLVGIMNSVRAELEAFEKMSGKEKMEKSYIPLVMFGIAKRAAIDARLVEANAADEPGSKTNVAVNDIQEDLDNTKDYKGTVAVFCDNYRRVESINDKKVESFNLFYDIRDKLIARGVPADQIVIMSTDMSTKKKEQIFNAVNSGEVRVIMGTTQTLGTGVNIQERLHMAVHIDAPVRPMDYTQRNGRILRQGNLHKQWNKTVRVIRYGVKDSLDVTAYQRLKTKAGFIDSIMNGKKYMSNSMEDRTLEEEEEGMFDNPVAILSGSQYAMELTKVERELRKYTGKKEQHRHDQIYIEKKTKENAELIRMIDFRLDKLKKVRDKFAGIFTDGKPHVVTFNGKSYKSNEELQKGIREFVSAKNKVISDIVIRESWRYTMKQEVDKYELDFDGIKVNVIVYASAYYNTGENKGYSAEITYNFTVPEIGEDWGDVRKATSIKNVVEQFNTEIATGQYMNNEISLLKDRKEQLISDTAIMEQRRGKAFEFEDKIAELTKRADEVREAMKAELKANEEKYSAVESVAANLDNISYEDEEDEQTDKAEAMVSEEDETLVADTDAKQMVVDELMSILGDDVQIVSQEDAEKEAYGDSAERMAKEKMLENLTKASRFVSESLTGKRQGTSFTIELPTSTIRMIKRVMGTDFDSHNITANSIVHSKNNHGENGKKITKKSIPLRDEDFSLAPYIMTAPSRVERGSMDASGRNSIRFIHELSNGYVAVVEKEQKESPDDMETITMWAEMSDGVADARNTSPAIDVQNVISNIDAAKIRKDAENTIKNDGNSDKSEFNINGNTVYGYAKNGKIYLTKEGLNPNTPIHEYTHLWAKAMQKYNPEGWNDIVKLLNNTPVWNDVVNDESYQNLKDDNAIASEVLSRISGKKNAEKMIAEAEKAIAEADGVLEKAKAISLRERMKRALEKFWNWVGTNLFGMRFSSIDEVTDRVLWDLVSGTDLGENTSDESEFSIRTKPAPENTGIGYKVFYKGKDGKLYPPMVANQGGVDTPVGVWLDAEEGTKAPDSKTGRPQVKQGGKGTQGGSGTLAYRPGWHLGKIPYALQFNRKDENGNRTLFPKDFVWAEVEYAMDKNYQEEAMQEGMTASGKFQHSLAGLKRIPEDGYYEYRTNPNPETDPWIITGAMKVNKVLTRDEVDELVRQAGREPQKVEGGETFDRTVRKGNGESAFDFVRRCVERINSLFPRGMKAYAVSYSMEPGELMNAIGVEDNNTNRKYYDDLQRLKKEHKIVYGLHAPAFNGNDNIIMITEDVPSFKDAILTYLHENMHRFIKSMRIEQQRSGLATDEFGKNMKKWFEDLKKRYIVVYGNDKLQERLNEIKDYSEEEKPEEFIIRYVTNCMTDFADTELIEPISLFGKFVDDYKEYIGYDARREEQEISGGNGQSVRPDEGNISGDAKGRNEGYIQKVEAAQQTADKLGVKVEFVSRDQMPKGHEWSMGVWHNGRILVCPANNPSADEAVRTVLHEAVGHEGLRKLVGSEYVESFCMELYRMLPESVRKEIIGTAVKKGNWNVATAVEEYLAEKAQDFNMDEEFRESFFDKVRTVLRNILSKIGINVPLSERDMRWLLYQNYYALHRSMKAEANRARLAHRLGLSESALKARSEAQDEIRDRQISSTFSAARLYNTKVSSLDSRLRETVVDQYDAINTLVDAIEKATGKKTQSFEDIRLALNQQSSKGYHDMEQWEKRYWKPLQEIVKTISKQTGHSVDDIERYLMLKHAVERNEVFAKRDARSFYQNTHDLKVDAIKNDERLDDATRQQLIEAEDKKLQKHIQDIEDGTDALYLQNRKTDYGGLTGIYSEYPAGVPVFDEEKESIEEYNRRLLEERKPMFDNVADMEAEARKETDAFESEIGQQLTDELWGRINAATKATLKHQYDHNMLSKDQYERIKDMFKYYIPMRGFDDTTAEDLYSYYTSKSGNQFQAPVIKAKGRTTKAGSPFGYIGAMASSGIAADMKNDSKLALWFFVNNRPDNDLITISETWYQAKADENGNLITDASGRKVFEPVYPPFVEDLTSEQAKESYRKWEAGMKALRFIGMAFHGMKEMSKQHLNYVIQQGNDQRNSHIITLKVGGAEKFIFINGNPRAAQSINNELNMDVEDSFQRIFGPINRFFSNINTSMNPEFWISNFQRDILFSLMSVDVKEDKEYNEAFRRNMKNALKAVKMNKAYEEGKLGKGYIEDMYRKFVENGGVTGYTRLADKEKWEAEVRKFAQENKSVLEKIEGGFDAVKASKVFEAIAMMSDGIEQINRFCAFLTSMEQGKDVRQAVADAKELTVNFNRKGSGKPITFEEAKKLRVNGEKLNVLEQFFAVAISRLNRFGRQNIIFWNASVQAINAIAQMGKINPKRLTKWGVMMFALGAINAAIHAMLDDDDDYLDIPDYERHNNLLIGGNGYYFKWALPQETRVLYGIGDMAVTYAMGRYPHKNAVKESLGMISAITPLDLSEGWMGAVPTYLRPAVEVAANKDFKGSQVYKDNKYLSDAEKEVTPSWNNAYRGTGAVYVNISRLLNAATGGDNVTAGKVNIHPEVIEHVVEGFTGGAGTTAARLYRSTIGGMLGLIPGEIGENLGNDWTMRNAPMLSRLFTLNDERYRNSYVGDLYWHYKGVYEAEQKKLKGYINAGDVKKATEVMESDDFKAAQIYKAYSGTVDMYNELMKMETDKNRRKELVKEQDATKAAMIKAISEIGKEK